MKKILILLSILVFFGSLDLRAQNCTELFIGDHSEKTVKIEKNQIVIDGEPQPNLYGAEFQYFRLRGGYGKNVARADVIAAWARGLDEMVAAGMNTISFYIPWDFHEYAPGKFDFTGTADEDHDGKADYPSRDILTFLKMVEERGFKRILLRPGPYINAEWGFLGFGAVPEWFHDQYPESHMQNPQGLKTKLYDYHNADFLRHTKLWFEELHRQVLSKVLGDGGPAIFLQLDNETNFQWQSIYNHDYGPNATKRYQNFLRNKYRSLQSLNQAQSLDARSWKDVRPPQTPGVNLIQDQDWYRFQDRSIYDYLGEVKKIWQGIGVHEPQVIFTLAESFNAPLNGLLPNYKYRNSKKTGMMTINIYPKTSPAPDNVLLHQPHKSDHDIMAAASATQHYLGSKQEAVIAPEVDTGWFNNIELSVEARKQTYLTLIGRGLKALYFYYFNEGFNWQVDWGRKKIEPLYDQLRLKLGLSQTPKENLPESFWSELQSEVDQQIMIGWNAKGVMFQDTKALQDLHFGAPLDAQGRPDQYYTIVQDIGLKIMKPYGEFLSRTVSLADSVAILSDPDSVVPSAIPGVDSRQLNSDFEGGLVGYILQAGINPSIHHWGINSLRKLSQNKIIFVQDSGNLNPKLVDWLAVYVAGGGTVVNFIGDSLAKKIGAPATAKTTVGEGAVQLANPDGSHFDALASSVSSYQLDSNSRPIYTSGSDVIAYSHNYGRGSIVQIGAVIHDAFNSDAYAFLDDVPARRNLLDQLVRQNAITSYFRIAEGGDRLDVFGRKAPGDDRLWVTVKGGQLDPTQFHVVVNAALVRDLDASYLVRNILGGDTQILSARQLVTNGFNVSLIANGSDAFLIEQVKN